PHRVATLPIDAIPSTLQRNVQILEPAYGGEGVERSRCIDDRIARGRIATNAIIPATAAKRSIQSGQQESLVVIYLDIAAECSIRERNSRGHVEQSGFLRVDLDKWLLPICDGRPPARIDESDIGEQSRAAGVPNKNAAIVHPTLYDRSRK